MNSFTIEDQKHLDPTVLHLLARGERAAEIREVERIIFVPHPMPVRRQIQARVDLTNQSMRRL